MRSITVRELIEALEDEDPEAQVICACNYGDIGKTQQVVFLTGQVEEATLERSAYSESGWAVLDEDDENEADGPESQQPRALVLR